MLRITARIDEFSLVHLILSDCRISITAPSKQPIQAPNDQKMASTSYARPSSSQLPPSVFNPRRHVNVQPERVSDVSNTEYPGHYPDEDHSWDLQKFKQVSRVPRMSAGLGCLCRNHGGCAQTLHIEVKRLSQRSIEFDLVGVDASIANAFRRILIAEVRGVCDSFPRQF